MRCGVLALLVFASVVAIGHSEEDAKKKHHRRHHHKHHKDEHKTATKSVVKDTHAKTAVTKAAATPAAHAEPQSTKPVKAAAAPLSSEEQIVSRMRSLKKELASKEKDAQMPGAPGHLEVNGPLPLDFSEKFSQGIAKATGTAANEVRVVSSKRVQGVEGDVEEVQFLASPAVVKVVEDQASDPDSKLATGELRSFLVAKDGDAGTGAADAQQEVVADARAEGAAAQEAPCDDKDIDIDTEMPYGELEPFGREDTAQELTEQSVKESDEMVDQLERAEVAEEKRAVFRALTRLRGAAITSFDGIARSQTGNIDEYNKIHKWRRTHPLHHLADEESDISKWAFPDNADF